MQASGDNQHIQSSYSLLIARWATGISLVMLTLQLWRLAEWAWVPCGVYGLDFLVGLTLALIPAYVWIWLRLRSHRVTAIGVGRGLGVAVWWAVLNLLLYGELLIGGVPSNWSVLISERTVIGWEVTYAGVQGILAVSALRAAAILAGAESIWFLLFGSTVRVGLYLFLLVGIARTVPENGRTPGDEFYAIGSLRDFNFWQEHYQRDHPDRGFASSVEELFYINRVVLVSTQWYRYEMSVGPRDEAGRIGSYQARATRLHPRGWCRSFFTDESRVIRSTAEDRPATAADPPLQGSQPSALPR